MNPSYPGSSGDRHSSQPPNSVGNGMNKNNPHGTSRGPPPHFTHAQPSMSQLSSHAGHHTSHVSGAGIHQQQHALHGNSSSSHGSLTSGYNTSNSGSGSHVPPHLPPPPLPSSLGGSSGSNRSPHPPLQSSILHPPRGNLVSTSSSGGLGSGSNPGGIITSSLSSIGHGRLPQPPQQPHSNSVIPSVSESMKPSSSYSSRPGSPPPRATMVNQQSHQNGGKMTTSQQQPVQKFIVDHPSSTENDNYYQTSSGMGSNGPPPPRHRELRVEDALLYLDQVKQQFGGQPDIYNQFLDVMKDFKAQAIDTPGVILRVSNLFRGYPNLILGFNTFLPPGYRIRPDTSIEVIPQHMGSGPRRQTGVPSAPKIYNNDVMNKGPGGMPSNAPNQVQHRPPPVAISPPYSSPKSAHNQGGMMGTHSNANIGNSAKSNGAKQQKKSQQLNIPGNNAVVNPAPPGGRVSTNPVEFDHAIYYVTTIKQRFADDPDTYKEFLAILHTYQKQQRSIRQVLDQVSHLFRDHPDLLREFTFFLPDAVQEPAKARLNAAAMEAQKRKDMLAKQESAGALRPIKPLSSSAIPHDLIGDSGMPRDKSRDKKAKHVSPRDELSHRSYNSKSSRMDRRDRDERLQNLALYDHKRSKRRSFDTKERRTFLAMSEVLIDREEWGVFEKVKKCLPSRDAWREFLKCLELYSHEILGRQEMLSLLRNLFGRHTELVDAFDSLLSSHGEQKNTKEIWPFIPLAETDLSQCRRATPSYRALPASYPIPPCSFRSKLERSVCNDSWVSVPTGSEDFSFKNMRKNQYEEALFKCEDERFEIDMVIDANSSTITVLEPLVREIQALQASDGGEEKLWNYVIAKGTLRVTHLNAITRIYGSAGSQILDLLRRYPAGALPVILTRLKQKDEEWRRARADLNKQWKEVNEKNYHKSLDHSSFYFKQKDKKQTSLKALVQEAKKELENIENAKEKAKEQETQATAESGKSPPHATAIANALQKEQESQEMQPHFTYKMSSVQIHKDAYGLLSYAAEKNLSVSDKEKVSKAWQSFFFPFFHLEEEWLVRKPKPTVVTVAKAKSLRAGTEVQTAFGEGTIQQFDAEKSYHVVHLPIAQAYLQPGSMTIQEASDYPAAIEVKDEFTIVDSDKKHQISTYYGTQHAYAFVRLYQMLFSRLEQAHELCEKAKRNRFRRTINPAARALAHTMHGGDSAASLTSLKNEKAGDYHAFLSKLYGLIDGSIDHAKYEDSCRSLMGSTSYFLFTMDKLVSSVLKQMQYLATDETCQKLLKLFDEYRKGDISPLGAQAEADASTTTASSPDAGTAYLNKSKSIFEGEGAYRIEMHPGILRPTNPNDDSLPNAVTPVGNAMFDRTKIWAPSPRVRPQESSKWLVEPTLTIQYLGAVEDDTQGEDDDSPSVTPPDTPSLTPMFGSPIPDTEAFEKTPQGETHDNSEDDDVFGSSDEEAHDSLNQLKKRDRSLSDAENERPMNRKKIKQANSHSPNAEVKDENASFLPQTMDEDEDKNMSSDASQSVETHSRNQDVLTDPETVDKTEAMDESHDEVDAAEDNDVKMEEEESVHESTGSILSPADNSTKNNTSGNEKPNEVAKNNAKSP